MHDKIRMMFKEGDKSLSYCSRRAEHADVDLFITWDDVHERE